MRGSLERWWWSQCDLSFLLLSLSFPPPQVLADLQALNPKSKTPINGEKLWAMRIQSLWCLLQLFLSSPGPTRAGVPFPGAHSLAPTSVPLLKYPLTASHSWTSKNWKENKPICLSSMQTSGLGFCQNRSHITSLKIMTKTEHNCSPSLLTRHSHSLNVSITPQQNFQK